MEEYGSSRWNMMEGCAYWSADIRIWFTNPSQNRKALKKVDDVIKVYRKSKLREEQVEMWYGQIGGKI